MSKAKVKKRTLQVKVDDQEDQVERINMGRNEIESYEQVFDENTDIPLLDKPAEKVEKKRLVSLDIFRGLNMTGMIGVDEQSGPKVIWPFNHSQWNGWTTADQVFPNFLFIMGMAIPFSMKPAERKNKAVWFRLIKRSFLLVLIGLLICFQQEIPSEFDSPFKLHFRIPGILQRLGICYFVVSTLYMLIDKIHYHGIVYVCTIIIYLCFQYAYDVPNYISQDGETYICGRGVLNIQCNFGGYLDRIMFGNGRFAWLPSDPEGAFGYLTSFFNTYMGLCFSLVMNKYKDNQYKLFQTWLIMALTLTSLGFFIGMWMPLNKKMWTLSFMFATSGISGVTLSLSYLIIDIKNYVFLKKFCGPFLWLGMNPLFIYVLLMVQNALFGSNINFMWNGVETNLWDWFSNNVFNSWVNNLYISGTLNAIFYYCIWVLIAWVLFKKKIIIKL